VIGVRHLHEWKFHKNFLGARSHIGTLIPAILILSALFIDVAAGRWGAYILTPIPGLYLPEALLVLGILTSIPNIHKLKDLPLSVRFVTALPIFYIFARLIEFFASGDSRNIYLIIRDLAPFAYLLLVPLIAVTLISAPFSWILWVLRISSVTQVVLVTMLSQGLLFPITVDFIKPDAAALFEFRGDLQGVIVGIGLISWGKWPGWASANRYVQFALIIFVFALEGRTALVTALFCLLIVAYRERKWFTVWRWILMVTGALLVIIALNGISLLTDKTAQELVTDKTAQELVTDKTAQELVTDKIAQELIEESDPSPILKIFPVFERAVSETSVEFGTLHTRLATYSLVLEYLPQNTFWLFGAGPGTDILYTICTGISDAPPQTRIDSVGGSTLLPKCPVDDANARSTLRDPHNWLLNLLVHHGTVGTLIFLIALGASVYWSRRSPNWSLGVSVIAAYFVCGTFGVILSAPFAMLPIAVMLGWMFRSNSFLLKNPVDERAQGQTQRT
jgi:hypothetical protein